MPNYEPLDLGTREALEDVRRLILARYGTLIRARGWDQEEVLQDVIVGLLKWPYDPSKAATSTWILMTGRSVISHRMDYEGRRPTPGTTKDLEGEPCDPAERAVGSVAVEREGDPVLDDLLIYLRARKPRQADRMERIIRGRMEGLDGQDLADELGVTRQYIHVLLDVIRSETGRWLDGHSPRHGH